MPETRKIYGARELTGGGFGALDSIDTTGLPDESLAYVCQGTVLRCYAFDADSVLTESSPDRIKPGSGPGCWLLQSDTEFMNILLVELILTNSALVTGQVLGGSEIPVCSELDGMDLVDVVVTIPPSGTVSSGGALEFQVVRTRDGATADMLSANLTIAEGENVSGICSIDGDNDDVATDDFVHVDCEADGTDAKGPIWVKLTFR